MAKCYIYLELRAFAIASNALLSVYEIVDGLEKPSTIFCSPPSLRNVSKIVTISHPRSSSA
jgi:hypothetical protein